MTATTIRPTFPPLPGLALVIAAATAFSFATGIHLRNWRAGYGLADFYWSQFWLTSYQDGFVRRSLLGSLLRLVFANHSNILKLSTIQLGVTIALLAMTLVIVYRLMSRAGSPALGLASAALIGFSPIGPLLFETTGDPLQVVVALYLAAMLAAPGRLAPLFIVALVGALIHEASIFFTAPHLVFALGARRGWTLARRWLVALGATLAFSAAVTIAAGHSAGTPSFFLANALNHRPIALSSDPTPGFAKLLREEFGVYFGDLNGVRYLIIKLAAFALAPLALALTLMTLARPAAKLLLLFGFFLISAAPLFVIAHDWGRFAGLMLILAFAAALQSPEREPAADTLADKWSATVAALAATPRQRRALVVALAAVALVASAFWSDYRIDGAQPSLVLALLLAGPAWLRLRRSSPALAAA